jgi:membrane protein involved in colicin uptake
MYCYGCNELYRTHRYQEERTAIQRAAREAERIALLSQMALTKQQEKEQQLMEEARQREQEDERKAREEMVMTVDLDSQHDAMNFDGDM